LRQSQSASGKPIEERGSNQRLPVPADVLATQVLDNDQQDIGRLAIATAEVLRHPTVALQLLSEFQEAGVAAFGAGEFQPVRLRGVPGRTTALRGPSHRPASSHRHSSSRWRWWNRPRFQST
jgi:hypothetical protein